MPTTKRPNAFLGQMKQIADTGDRMLIACVGSVGRFQRAMSKPIGEATRTALGAARVVGTKVGAVPERSAAASLRTVPRLPLLLSALDQVIAEHDRENDALRRDPRFWRLLHLIQAHRPWARSEAFAAATVPSVPWDEPVSAETDNPVLMPATSMPRRDV